MIDTDTKKKIWYLHTVKKMNNTKISQQLGVSRGSVIKVLKDESTVNEQFLKDAERIERKANESLLQMLQNDNRIPSILSKVLNKFDNDESLDKEIDKFGLKSLGTIIGIISDKVIKASELSARIERPESFSQVTIINDADEVAKYKEQSEADSETIVN